MRILLGLSIYVICISSKNLFQPTTRTPTAEVTERSLFPTKRPTTDEIRQQGGESNYIPMYKKNKNQPSETKESERPGWHELAAMAIAKYNENQEPDNSLLYLLFIIFGGGVTSAVLYCAYSSWFYCKYVATKERVDREDKEKKIQKMKKNAKREVKRMLIADKKEARQHFDELEKSKKKFVRGINRHQEDLVVSDDLSSFDVEREAMLYDLEYPDDSVSGYDKELEFAGHEHDLRGFARDEYGLISQKITEVETSEMKKTVELSPVEDLEMLGVKTEITSDKLRKDARHGLGLMKDFDMLGEEIDIMTNQLKVPEFDDDEFLKLQVSDESKGVEQSQEVQQKFFQDFKAMEDKLDRMVENIEQEVSNEKKIDVLIENLDDDLDILHDSEDDDSW